MCTFACHVPPIRSGMHDTCMNPDVEITVFKILFYEILIMLGIKFIIKKQMCLQGFDTNLELNTCPLPK